MKRTIFSSTGLVIVYLMAVIGFSSCSSNDGGTAFTGGGAPTVDGKNLKYIKEGYNVSILDYDTDGRVLSILKNGVKTIYSYSDDQVTCTSTASGSAPSGYVVTYSLTGGRITKKTNDEGNIVATYEYDANGFLISYSTSESSTSSDTSGSLTHTSSEKFTYTWKDGNIETVTRDFNSSNTHTYSYGYARSNSQTSHRVSTYTYSSHTLTLPLFVVGDDEVLGWQGYFGRMSRNLPSKEQRVETQEFFDGTDNKVYTSTSSTEYVYSFNGNMLEKVTLTQDGYIFSVIELTWN